VKSWLTVIVSVKLWSHSDMRIWAPSWTQRTLCLGALWNISKATGLPWTDMGHKGHAN